MGCGGTIRKLANQGDIPYALILAEGISARHQSRDEAKSGEISSLWENARKAAEIIGYRDIFFEGFPDNRMDSVDLLDVIHKVSKCINMLKPETVLTHHTGDLNIDHRITNQAVLTACRPLNDCPVRSLLTFETLSSTEWNFPLRQNAFSPSVWIDISETIDAKSQAMNCYASEIRPYPHPRSPEIIRAAAQKCGSVIERAYAEAFELIYAKIF